MFAASKTAKAASAAAATDPQFNYVTMLLHGDGTNGAQNNTFLDSSTNNFTITRNGNTTQGTFSPYGSNWSNYFDGSGDYLTASTTAGDFGSSAFTMEAWVYFNSASGTQVIGSTYQSASVGWSFGKSNGTGCFYVGLSGDGNDINGTTTVVAGTWYHIAVSGTPGATGIKLFVNGVQEGSTYTGAVSLSATVPVYIGDLSALGYVVNGYISNFRIVKGTAVYTSAFTPSTTPLTAITNTSLLTCQSNRFIDNSTNNFTITKTGDVSVQRFSPFSPSSAYSTSVIGGSGYFDGSGDYLNTPTSGQFSPTGDFTVSFWYYPTTLNTYNTVIGNYTSTASTDWFIEFTSNGSVNVYTNGSTIRITGGSGTIKSGQWSFVTLSRSGTTITFKVNGTSIGTYTQSGTFGSATKTIYIGQYFTGSEYITGYLSDVRLLDGSEVTTIPTSPLTSVSGTNLLLNFTNAGILDNAMMNDLETVGNAQISTSVKKYGTGSMYFDGTGDWLVTPYNPNWILSGNFTIELWLYWTAHGSYGGIVGCANSNTGAAISAGWYLDFNSSSNNLQFEGQGGVSVVTTNVIPSSQWVHIAVVRSGSTITHYLNGVSNGSGTSSTSFNSSTFPLYVGVDRGASSTLTGYIDDLRITKYARYVANFTPPTAAFPNN